VEKRHSREGGNPGERKNGFRIKCGMTKETRRDVYGDAIEQIENQYHVAVHRLRDDFIYTA
jgi:hypothetical protein